MAELFDPIDIRGVRVPNRVVRSATSERAADEDGRVTPELVEYYRPLGAGGAGLVVTGYAYVRQDGRCNPRQLGLFDDSLVPGLAELVRGFHSASGDGGAKIAAQIVHGGRQVPPTTRDPIAPSAIPEPVLGTQPRALFEEEIEELVLDFAEAARRAMEAGFDAVQLHAAHGYLISEFLSPLTNRRTDRWGGSPQGRRRFALEIVARVREEIGDMPLMLKLNLEDGIEDGLIAEEGLEHAVALAEAGVDAIEVSAGMLSSPKGRGAVRGPEGSGGEGYLLSLAAKVKSVVKIPIIAVGGFRSRVVIDTVIRSGQADMVAMARPLIREPDLPKKFIEGKDRSDCVSCSGCHKGDGPTSCAKL